MKKKYIIAFLILCFWKGALADGIVPKITKEFETNEEGVERIAPTKTTIKFDNVTGGTYMYKGPSIRSYERVMLIPNFEEVTVTHKIEKLESPTSKYVLQWYYTEYQGKKGWVSCGGLELGCQLKEVTSVPTPSNEKGHSLSDLEKDYTPVPTPGDNKTPEEKDPSVVQPTPTDSITPEEKEPIVVPTPDNDRPNPTPVQQENNKEKSNTKTIIIGVLSSIVGALICLIIIMFTNRKSKKDEWNN